MTQSISKWLPILALGAALLSPNQAHSWGLTFVIADAVRDGNWSLKTLKDEIIHSDNMLSWKAVISLTKNISEHFSFFNEGLSSYKIRGATTATSITENNATEERYSAMDLPLLVCAALKMPETPESLCDIALAKRTEQYQLLENALKGTSNNDSVFTNKMFEATEDDAGDDKSKVFLKNLARAMESAERLTDYSLIEKDEYNNLQEIINLIMLDDMNTTVIEDVFSRDDKFNIDQLAKIQTPLLLKAILDDNIKRREFDDNHAPDLKFINQGSAESHINRVKALAETDMTAEIQRQIALNHAANTYIEFRKLKASHIKQTEMALKLKELRRRHGDH
ncbi:hypothetical protein QTV44_002617 [Vibrio vulnificus]|nr:hypothetical protein [Vibrio vulnificus]